MKKLTVLFLCFAVVVFSSVIAKADLKASIEKTKAAVMASANADDATKNLVVSKLLPILNNKTLVDEVKAQNAKGVSLGEIKKIDSDWQKAESPMPIMNEKANNACANELKKIIGQVNAIREVFVMDNQGAVVGESNLTSDYWQGDEEKWTKSFNGGAGGVDIAKSKFDSSANSVIQQISLPIFDADGTVIGAVTFGISVGK